MAPSTAVNHATTKHLLISACRVSSAVYLGDLPVAWLRRSILSRVTSPASLHSYSRLLRLCTVPSVQAHNYIDTISDSDSSEQCGPRGQTVHISNRYNKLLSCCVMLRAIQYFAKLLKITRDHSKWYHSKALVRFPIRIPFLSLSFPR